MKKNKIKGLSAFELLEGLDDDMILSASLPEEAPIPLPTKGERVAAFFTHMGKSGIAAAVVSAAVIVGILVGVVLSGRIGPVQPSDTDQSHGIQGNPPLESGMVDGTNDGNNGVFIPPLNQPSPQEKGPVSVVSDGITVYPAGYTVSASGEFLNQNGEWEYFKADGIGAVSQLQAIRDQLPHMTTAGNSYELNLPGYMSLRNVRAFRAEAPFDEVPVGFDGASHNPMFDLPFLPSGEYIVVLDIYSETYASMGACATELSEYAFRLTVESNIDITFPVRMLIDGKTHYLEGTDGINSGHALGELAPSIPTAIVTRESDVDFYLSPQGTLESVSIYDGSFRLMMTETFISLPTWAEGDYYFVFTVSFPFEGGSLTLEYPFHVELVEKTEEDETEEDNGIEIPSMPEEYHLILEDLVLDNGCMLWAEAWYNGMMESADGLGAKGQLAELVAGGALDDYRLRFPVDTPFLYKHKLTGVEAPLNWVTVYDRDLNLVGEAPNFTVIHTPPLPAGEYIVVLTVKYQENYIPEADAYEGICYEYPFILELYDPE